MTDTANGHLKELEAKMDTCLKNVFADPHSYPTPCHQTPEGAQLDTPRSFSEGTEDSGITKQCIVFCNNNTRNHLDTCY